MNEITTIGLDLAKHVFQVHGVDEKQLMPWHKSNPVSQRLATIPGIGPIIATAIAVMVAEPWLSQRSRICIMVGSGAAAEFHRRQKPVRRHPSEGTNICDGC